MGTDILRIGNAGGYWGDDLGALQRQIDGGPIDVITMDFLAEITMSILHKQLQRDPRAGYARDFVAQMRAVMATALERGVTIISNAGGARPRSCAEALLAAARELGLNPTVGVVEGDDVLDRLAGWVRDGVDLSNMDDGRPFGSIADRVISANVYFGAEPVVEALNRGAQIVVTGRVTDTGITVAPMIHHFGWRPDDFDKIASGIVAGHILECGAQSTGGNFTDWREVPSFHRIGYPIVEVCADGSFVVTKHEGSGGLVSVDTVREQLVYEMGDPTRYLTPDAVVDFTSVRLEPDGPDRVRVSGVRGAAPTDSLKVSMSHAEGFKASGAVIVCGPDARAKSDTFADILWNRLPSFEVTLVEHIGENAAWGPLSPATEAPEIMLRFGVRDSDRAKVQRFSTALPALILSGPPGVAVTGGRPPVQDVVAYWPCLIPRELCTASVEVMGATEDKTVVEFTGPTGPGRVTSSSTVAIEREPMACLGEPVTVPLSAVAHGRSGDKGDTCNIGIIARHPAVYPWLKENTTAQWVKEAFRGIASGEVERFEVPNIDALNFLLHGCLGGGGTLSLHIDAQGKTYSHALLSIEVTIDRAYVKLCRRPAEN